jgi:hypothetical protein
LTEQQRQGNHNNSGIGKTVDKMASVPKSPNTTENATAIPSGSSYLRRRKSTKAPDKGEQFSSNNLKTDIFQSAKELIDAKGYKVIHDSHKGVDLIASKPVELDSQNYLIDVLPIGFHNKSGTIKIGGNDGALPKVVKGESESINSLTSDLTRNTRNLLSSISNDDGLDVKLRDRQIIHMLTEGLERHSMNLLFGRLDSTKLKGRNVKFWVNPVIFTTCQLQNEVGESRPWIPAKLGDPKVDIVSITNLASYLDLREKELRILGRETLEDERGLGDFPRRLKVFRVLTLSAALALLVAFLVLALNTTTWFPTALSGLVIASAVEAYGGLQLLRSYRRLRRDNNKGICLDSKEIGPEQLVANENQFDPDEQLFLYTKYGGAELSRLKKELKTQRIKELVKKSEDFISKGERLESEKLYSDAILSTEKAARSSLSAILLSMGKQVQARDIDQWIPSLKSVLKKEESEALRNLMEMGDKINKGYDPSHQEVEKARETAGQILESAIDYLTNSNEENLQRKSSTYESPLNDLRITSQTITDCSRKRLREPDEVQENEKSEREISKEVLNPTQSLKFLLNVADDGELLTLGSAGDYLLKAKKTLNTDRSHQNIRTEFSSKESPTILEELGNLTRSLTPARPGFRGVDSRKRNVSSSFSDKVVAPDRLLPFEDLLDFRGVLARCQLPIVASFLSDDEPSDEVKKTMKGLVSKYRDRAAFIAINSRSEEIARECKIKSYPTILVFNDGKLLGELKLTTAEQLEKDMLKAIGSTTSSDREKACGNEVQLRTSESEVSVTRQTGQNGEGIT